MSKRSSGLFSGRTRNLARHHKPSHLSVSDMIQSFKVGDKVAIVPKGSVKNIPHPRYKGKVGTVIEKRGNGYVVQVKAMTATKTLVVNALHLKRM